MNGIVVDIGNTSTSLALWRGGRIGRVVTLAGKLKDVDAIERAIGRVGKGVRLDGAMLSSVVPRINRMWLRSLARVTGVRPLLLTHRLDLGIAIDYPRPETIGTDRLADAAGAVGRFGAPVIVADFGTALTFNVVSATGAYLGGVIAPGLPLMTEYLAEKTALLPKIALKGACGPIGRSTVEAMRIGARVGYQGMVREILGHVRGGMGLKRARLCATGGYARWALRGSGLPFVIDPNLTLYGLGRILELNGVAPVGRRP